MSTASALPHDAAQRIRWTQLIIAIACMVLIANLQYGWTLVVNPIA